MCSYIVLSSNYAFASLVSELVVFKAKVVFARKGKTFGVLGSRWPRNSTREHSAPLARKGASGESAPSNFKPQKTRKKLTLTLSRNKGR